MAVAVAIGYVVASAVALTTWHVVNDQWREVAMDRYGTALAEDLAHLALEPLLSQDRIRLGVLAERLARRPEVRRIAVYTVDNRLFVVAGEAHAADVPTFIRPIAVQDTVAGDVHVALNADRFGLSVIRMLERGWFAILGGFVLVVVLAAYVSHASRRRQGARSGAEDGPPPEPTYMLVANLIAAKGTSATQRSRTLRRGMAVAERVANLYAGQAEQASDSGVLMRFRATAAPERGFEVVCAALLLRRLLNRLDRSNGDDPTSPSADDVRSSVPFRYGLDLSGDGATTDAGSTSPTARVSPFANVLLLSSLAPPGELAIGEAAYDAIDRPLRLKVDDLDNPATQALSAGLAVPRGIIRGVSEDYEALLARQAAVIGNGPAETR
ncbi:MAG: hypothetical protein F4X98_02800 [Gammaproteobacteria bacterium]|nr:hypothetical protein [Gammaproteobacteria bacterium]